MTRYPLAWPVGWRRTTSARDAQFHKKTNGRFGSASLTISDGVGRVLTQLRCFGVRDGDAMLSTNVPVRLDGLPRSNEKEPEDPGVAVYWQKSGDTIHRVIAIDLYTRVADNLAAVAATLEAMRAIERHGGAVILERAFLGFAALPAPHTWRSVFNYDEQATPTLGAVKELYRHLAKVSHPDMGGSEYKMQELNLAMQAAEKELVR